MGDDGLTYKIRGAIFRVHSKLGPGLLENVYHAALLFELSELGLKVCSQVTLPVLYKGIELNTGFRIDLLIEESIIIEIKSRPFMMFIRSNY